MSETPSTPDRENDDGDAARVATAAAALGEVWSALDALPAAWAAAPLAATTLEMVAAELKPARRPAAGFAVWSRQWLGPVAAVFAALFCGLVVGRITAPDGDDFLLRNLPLARHLDLLRELHSVDFLEELGAARPQPPRRLLIVSGRPDLQAEQARLVDEIAALRAAGPWGSVGRNEEAERRHELSRLEPAERERLRGAAAAIAEMPREERRRIEEIAAALVAPGSGSLLEAARLWRLWVAASDPLDRDEIVALDAAKRLEWMRRQSRLDGFGPQRPRPDGPPPEGPPPFRRPRRGDRPRPPDMPEDDRRPPPFSPDRPGPAGPPPADAGETRAAPR